MINNNKIRQRSSSLNSSFVFPIVVILLLFPFLGIPIPFIALTLMFIHTIVILFWIQITGRVSFLPNQFRNNTVINLNCRLDI